MLFLTLHVISVFAFTICSAVWMIELQKFLKDSKYLNVCYMPADRFNRIRVFFIISIVLLFAQQLFGWVYANLVSIILFVVLGPLIGYTLALFSKLHKANNWTEKENPKAFITTLYVTTAAMTIYLGYMAFRSWWILYNFLQQASTSPVV